MGIFGNLFNSAAREEDEAKKAYDHAKLYRKGRLARFRQVTIQTINRDFPDAKFLMNMHSPSFIAYSHANGVVLIGIFSDVIFPQIELVSSFDEGPVAANNRRSAVDNFENLVTAFDSMDFMANLPPDTDELSKNYMLQISTKGHYILKAIPVEMIVRVILQKNENDLACADWWQSKSQQHFFDAVVENVETLSGERKTSHIAVRIDFLSGSKRNYFIYKSFFNENHDNIPELREPWLLEKSGLQHVLPVLGSKINMPEELKNIGQDEAEELESRFSDVHWREDDSRAYSGHIT